MGHMTSSLCSKGKGCLIPLLMFWRQEDLYQVPTCLHLLGLMGFRKVSNLLDRSCPTETLMG